MADINFFRALMQQASAEGSRSTALQPLLWSLGTLLAATVFAAKTAQAYAVVTLLSALTLINCLLLFSAYIFLLIKDRDALRSERFNLSKMALEKTITGDSISGFRMIESSTLGESTEVQEGADFRSDVL